MNNILRAADTAFATGIGATTGTELLFGGNHTEVRLIEELMAVARRVWPRKTAAELASRLGVSTRAAEKWMAHAGGMSGEQYAGLLRTDHGLAFLRASVPPACALWRAMRDEYEAEFLRGEIAKLKERLRDE